MLPAERTRDLRLLKSHVMTEVRDVAARALGKTDNQYKTNSIS